MVEDATIAEKLHAIIEAGESGTFGTYRPLTSSFAAITLDSGEAFTVTRTPTGWTIGHGVYCVSNVNLEQCCTLAELLHQRKGKPT